MAVARRLRFSVLRAAGHQGRSTHTRRRSLTAANGAALARARTVSQASQGGGEIVDRLLPVDLRPHRMTRDPGATTAGNVLHVARQDSGDTWPDRQDAEGSTSPGDSWQELAQQIYTQAEQYAQSQKAKYLREVARKLTTALEPRLPDLASAVTLHGEGHLTAGGGPIYPAVHLRGTSTLIAGDGGVVLPAMSIVGTGNAAQPVPAVDEVVSRAVSSGIGGFTPSELMVIAIVCLVVVGAGFWHLLPAELKAILGPIAATGAVGYPVVQQVAQNRNNRNRK